MQFRFGLSYELKGIVKNYTFGRSTIPVFIQATQAHSASTSLRG